MNFEDHKGIFRTEALELLASLEQVAMELESSPDNQDCIGQAFRVMHTLKGTGAMYGFDSIASLAHDLEAVLDKVRAGEIVVCSEIIDIILEAKDLILVMVNAPGITHDTSRIKSRLDVFLGRDGQNIDSMLDSSLVSSADAVFPPPFGGAAGEHLFRIHFRPARDIYKKAILPEMILKELAGYGELVSVAVTDNVPDLEEIEPESCYLSWDIHLTTTKSLDEIRDVFIFVEDGADIRIESMDMPGGENPVDMPLSEAVSQGTTNNLPDTLEEKKRSNGDYTKSSDTRENIRVSSEKLDGLIDLVGELVTTQESLNQVVSGWEEYDISDDHEEFFEMLREGNFNVFTSLISIAEQFSRLTADIRERSMSIRMIPIGSAFSKYTRLVRDLSRQLGKNIKLVTEGGDTELDKNIIEKLSDSLVHIVRNCVDHGIEQPAERERNGKVPEGTLLLSAEYSGKNVIIRISDDGRGIDADSLAMKALERGVITSTENLSDSERLDLIFAPGLSTSMDVTDISGRGVGMDVVKRSIEALRGTVNIVNLPGKGTEISLTIPLTLAIIDGLLVRVNGSHYVFPLSDVEECFEIQRDDLSSADGNRLVNLRGHLIPYARLRRTFGESGDEPEFQHMVVTRVDDTRFGFVVDHIIGKHQTVIKSISELYKRNRYISGGTILGDGTVSLILDVKELAEISGKMDMEKCLN